MIFSAYTVDSIGPTDATQTTFEATVHWSELRWSWRWPFIREVQKCRTYLSSSAGISWRSIPGGHSATGDLRAALEEEFGRYQFLKSQGESE